MEKLKEYDGIILSSPIYMGGVSGKLKVFIDRTCKWFHRPELVGKPVLLVSTTAASGLIDKKFWIAKDWNKKLYYFDCKINTLNKTISKNFYKMLSKKVVKVGE